MEERPEKAEPSQPNAVEKVVVVVVGCRLTVWREEEEEEELVERTCWVCCEW